MCVHMCVSDAKIYEMPCDSACVYLYTKAIIIRTEVLEAVRAVHDGPRVTWKPGCKCTDVLCDFNSIYISHVSLCFAQIRMDVIDANIALRKTASSDPWRVRMTITRARPIKMSCQSASPIRRRALTSNDPWRAVLDGG